MKIALLGYGKMGKAIEQVAVARGHEIVLRLNAQNQEELKKLHDAEVAIEFSVTQKAIDHIEACFAVDVPVVVGTTGWNEEIERIRALCLKEQKSLFYASNFSIGVNLFFSLNVHLAKLMNKHPEYEISLEEIHHVHKLDTPSGTAISLAEDILAEIPSKKRWVNQEDKNEEVLPIHSIRKNEVPGTHKVSYDSKIDSLTIQHEAHGREGFAVGAVVAAEWLVGKKGCYTMKDLLNMNHS